MLFLAFNAVFGIPCHVWHLMHEMAFNAKNSIVLQFCIENVLIPMQRGIKCQNWHQMLKSALYAK